MRTIYILISLLILIITGCSSNSIDPITPSGSPDDSFRDATAMSAGSGQIESDKYWNDSLIVGDKLWIAHRNPNGTAHYALGPGVDISSDPLTAVSELGNIFPLSQSDLQVSSDEIHAGLRIVFLRQYYNGLRVWPSMAQLVYSRNGKLIKTMADIFPGINLNTVPTISSSTAINAVKSEVGETEIQSCDLVIHATWNSSALAYRVRSDHRIHFVDANDGSVIEREHLQWDTYSGNVSGYASQPNWYDPEEIYEFSNLELRVRIDPEESYPTSYLPLTNLDGNFMFESPEPELEAELRTFGPWLNINNRDNFPYNELSIREPIFNNTPLNFLLDSTNSLRDERTVWYWANHAWDYMKMIDPTGHEMDWRLIGNIQNAALCNAMANDTSINFYKSVGPSCLNLGEVPDVIVHEWGHVHMYNQFGDDLPDGTMREGNSDITANTICDHPFIGWNAQGEGLYFRLSDNELMWPLEECGGQSHCMGRLIAGAFWDFREIVGRDYNDYIWHFSKYMHPQTFQDWGADALIVDDDDDNPLNGSPHYNTIYQCWETNHNLDIPDATDIPTTGIIIDLVPYNPEVRIAKSEPNKHFDFNLKIMNLDDEQKLISVWAAVDLPWSMVYGPVIPPSSNRMGPVNVPIAPLQTYNLNLTQNLPFGAPVGEYVYHVRTGEFVDHINDILVDDASFSFWIY